MRIAIRALGAFVALAIVAGVVFAMIGLSFASVPLYRLFCAATGYDGTPSFADGTATR